MSTLNFRNLSTAVTFEFLPWHILKYTFWERKWAKETISGIKFHQKCRFFFFFFEKITKNHFFGSKFLWQANKNNFELKCPNYWKIMIRQVFLFCFVFVTSPTLIFFEYMTKNVKKRWFSWRKKNQIVGYRLLIIWKIKDKVKKQKQNKKKNTHTHKKKKHIPIVKWHDKSSNFDFKWLLFELSNCENPPNWTVRNHWFSNNSDIFLHLMLLWLPMPLFLNLQWEYVLQITDKHLYTMSNTLYIFIF